MSIFQTGGIRTDEINVKQFKARLHIVVSYLCFLVLDKSSSITYCCKLLMLFCAR